MIAVSSNDVDVLLLLLQAASAVVTWSVQDAIQLPLARLLTLVPPSHLDDEEPRAAELQEAINWACDDLSSSECHLLDQIALGCPYTLRQLQRAMAAAAAGGQAEVRLLPSARMMVKLLLITCTGVPAVAHRRRGFAAAPLPRFPRPHAATCCRRWTQVAAL
jgi:hypothetical protein